MLQTDEFLTGGTTGVAKVCDIVHGERCWLCETFGENASVSLCAGRRVILVSKQEDCLWGNSTDLGSLLSIREEIEGGEDVTCLRVLELVDNFIEGIRVVDGSNDTAGADGSQDGDTKVVLLILFVVLLFEGSIVRSFRSSNRKK